MDDLSSLGHFHVRAGMAREVPSIDVPLPSADLLQSAYESVRPHLKPEDVPAALTREVSPGEVLMSMYGAIIHFLERC